MRLIVVLLFSVLSTLSYANFWFKNLESDVGLSLVRSVCRDSRDYLWIGNDGIGLMRYDGYQIVRYPHDPNDSSTVNGDGILRIFEDSKKQLWVGTRDGICRYDYENDEFVRYYFTEELVRSTLPENYVYEIAESPDSILWVLSRTSIFQYNCEQDKFELLISERTGGVRDFTSLDWDSKGRCWITSINKNGIFLFDEKSKSLVYFDDKQFKDDQFGEKTIFIDSDDVFWFGFYSKGLAIFDPETGKFNYFSNKPDGKGTRGTFIQSIIEWDRNTILVGIDQGGVNVFNKLSGTFKYITYDSPNHGTLLSDGIYTLYKDHEGILWVGTSRGGVSYYNPKESRFRTYQPLRVPTRDENGESYFPSYSIISCFHEDSEGLIWIGTDGRGVDVFNPERQKFKHVDMITERGEKIELINVRSIDEDMDGTVWIASWNDKIVSYNRRTGYYKQHDFSGLNFGGYNRYQYWSLSIDSKDDIWITYPIGYVALFKKNESLIKEFFTADSINSINTIMHESEFNTKYIISWRGVFRYDEQTMEMNQIIHMPELISMEFGENESLWIGTERQGIFHFDRDGRLLSQFSTVDGLADNTVNAIVRSGDQIWMSTNNGLSRLNTTTNQITNFSKEDGLQGSKFFFQSALQTKSGEVFFGGTNGFSSFYPDSIKPNDIIPPVYINDIYLLNRKEGAGKDSIANKEQVDYTEQIAFDWRSQLSLEINYQAINYTFPYKIKYKYIMEGLEMEWNTVESHFRKAIYTNLAPGNYTFRVKACNNDGIWNDVGKSVAITINKPFWRAYWFYIIELAALIYIVYLIISIREKKIQYDRKVLQRKVHERTMLIQRQKEELEVKSEELEAQNEELFDHRTKLEKMVDERTRDLLTAKERAEESDRLKSLFLANMSHEIRTPMNAIVGFSELLADAVWNKEERSQFVSMIQANSDSLLSLIEDILDFSLMESNQLKIHVAELSVNELLDTIYASFALRHRAKKVEIRISNSIRKHNYSINSDEHRIQQILNNLMSNALKFTEEGYIEIGVRTTEKVMEFFVKDTAFGLSIEEQAAIFDRFVKLEKEDTETKRGVGLGLSISRRLAELMGGELYVDSEPGKGSEFIFSLPMRLICNSENGGKNKY